MVGLFFKHLMSPQTWEVVKVDVARSRNQTSGPPMNCLVALVPAQVPREPVEEKRLRRLGRLRSWFLTTAAAQHQLHLVNTGVSTSV